jgi:hypothetical protein
MHEFTPASEAPAGGGSTESAGVPGKQTQIEAAAAGAISAKGSGEALPAPFADAASHAYGADMSDVRVHSGGSALTAASSMGAEAFTHGSDVFLGGGHQAGTDHGNFVMMHELAHVAQGRGAEPAAQAKLEVGETSDPAEREADDAAEVAMTGGTTTIPSRGSAKVRRFEAGTVKRDPTKPVGSQFKVEEGGHAFLTANALQTMGLTNDQAAQSYQGNWMRDLSQVFVPGLTSKIEAAHIMPILQVISIKEFGKGFNEKEFGTYDPVEHIDNPTDLTGSGVFQQYPPETSIPLAKVACVDPVANAQHALDKPENFDNPGGPLTPAGTDDQAYADLDQRYAATAQKNTTAINTTDAKAFQMNATGVPNYINTSKEWCKSTLRRSATEGRGDLTSMDDKNLNADTEKEHQQKGGDPIGPRDFASGIHTMQDYYAHSNFCEVAINSLIKAGKFQIAAEGGTPGQMETVDKTKKVDSKVKKNDAGGNPLATVNMKVGDLPGYKKADGNADREVISTGSFNLTDTAVSLLYVVKDKVLELNPWKDKQNPSPLANAALDYIDMAKPDGFNAAGHKISAVLRPLGTAIKAAGSGGAAVVSGGGHLAGGTVKAAGTVGGGFFSLLNKGNALLGGDADYWDKEKHSVEDSTNATGNAIEGGADETATKIRQATSWLDNKATEIDGKQHILRDVYGWYCGIDLLAPLKAMVRAIPVLGSTLGDLIDTAQKTLHDLQEEILSGIWILATKIVIGQIQGIIEWLKGQTNIDNKKKAGKKGQKAGPEFLPDFARKFLGDKKADIEQMLGGVGEMYDDTGKPKNGIAPASYTPPSHSEVAKDHHAKDPAVQAAQEAQEPTGPDGADVDGGDWLNSLAETLAQTASNAIGKKVSSCWDLKDGGKPIPDAMLDEVGGEVDHYFQHPDDCPDTWRVQVEKLFQNAAFAARLRKELSKGNT